MAPGEASQSSTMFELWVLTPRLDLETEFADIYLT